MGTRIQVEFPDDADAAEVQGVVAFLRRVAQVEFVSSQREGRQPTPDGAADVTYLSRAYLKTPDGKLLARLEDDEADVVLMLLDRSEKGLGPVYTQQGLMHELRAYAPGRWSERKSVSGATGAYHEARRKLAETEYALASVGGAFGFVSEDLSEGRATK